MSNLVIVESPYKINTIRSFLGSGYKVVASIGHVRDLPKSALGVDIENDFAPHYINIRGKGEVIASIRKDAKNASKVYLATDPDREGEAISWHLSQALGIPTEQTLRITFNEITKDAVKNAIRDPRQIDMNLVNAQQTRRILDRIVGYKISPLLWKNVKSGLSAGRVQSVATRIIVEREEEIRAFEPEEYWTIRALLDCKGTDITVFFQGNRRARMKLRNRDDVDRVIAAVNRKPFTVLEVKNGQKKKMPAPPFTTSTLLQEASRKLNFQSQRIMRIAQELYEGVNLGAEFGGEQGLITYMRTDSLRVSEGAAQACKDYILSKYGTEYYPSHPRAYKTDSDAQDAHEAIRPTHMELEPARIRRMLTLEQYRLYKLIWDRFVASQMESATLETSTVDFMADIYRFRATGTHFSFLGYRAVYEETSDEQPIRADSEEAEEMDIAMPALSEGEVYSALAIQDEQHFTEPPPRFTEASLIEFLKDKGIGRPSTYTPIITTIVTREYVRRDGKTLLPTELGNVTTKLMKEHFPRIVDYQFTADMENRLDAVEGGRDTMHNVLRDFWDEFKDQLNAAESSIDTQKVDVAPEQTDLICEKCGSRMVLRVGRFGKFAACPNYPNCKNTKSLSENDEEVKKQEPVYAPFRCEKCGAQMVLRTGRYGSFYACTGFPSCTFTKQKTQEADVKCPRCGGKLLTRYSRTHIPFYSCENYPECQFSSWDKPTNEVCPKCGKPLFIKKSKKQLYCRNHSCDYSRPISAEEPASETSEEEGT